MNTCPPSWSLDMAGAVEVLLPLSAGPQMAANAVSRTAMDLFAGFRVGTEVSTRYPPDGQNAAICDKSREESPFAAVAAPLAVSACPDKQKRPLTALVNGRSKEREKGFEPSTSSLGS